MRIRFSPLPALFVFLCLIGWAQAHEVQPTIITLSFAEDGTFNLRADTNAEALLAGIGAEHDDTDTSPNALYYGQLRKLPPDQLEPQLRDFLTRIERDFGLSFNGKTANVQLGSLFIPDVQTS